jgi:hypothetical protein
MCVQCNGLQLESGLARSLFYGLHSDFSLPKHHNSPYTALWGEFHVRAQVYALVCVTVA